MRRVFFGYVEIGSFSKAVIETLFCKTESSWRIMFINDLLCEQKYSLVILNVFLV